MDDFVTGPGSDPEIYVVQAYMYLLVGNKRMGNGDHEGAIRWFQDARVELAKGTNQPLLIKLLLPEWTFDDFEITIQRRLCDALLAAGHAKEASNSLFRMVDRGTNMTESIKTWVSDFKGRCSGRLQDLGDTAMNAKQYDKAISHYTTALMSASPRNLLAKRSKAYAENRLWSDALDDANTVIELDASCPSGYERKYATLIGMGHLDDAAEALNTMLSKMSESSQPDAREQHRVYDQTMPEICTSIKLAVCIDDACASLLP